MSADKMLATKWINFVMGTLPGWWLGQQDGRYHEPYVSAERWDTTLRAAGFNGIDSVSHDGYLNNNLFSRPAFTSPMANKLTVLCVKKTADSVARISKLLRGKGYSIDYCTIEESPPPKQDILCLLDLYSPFLHDAARETYEQFVKFMSRIQDSGLLWVTGACQLKCRDPRYALVLGFARVCRVEMSIDFGTLELETFDESGWQIIPSVIKEFENRLGDTEADPTLEWSYSNGQVQISRFHSIQVSEELKRDKNPSATRKLEMRRPGLAHMYWKQIEPQPPSEEEVEVDIRAVGLNFRVG